MRWLWQAVVSEAAVWPQGGADAQYCDNPVHVCGSIAEREARVTLAIGDCSPKALPGVGARAFARTGPGPAHAAAMGSSCLHAILVHCR